VPTSRIVEKEEKMDEEEVGLETDDDVSADYEEIIVSGTEEPADEEKVEDLKEAAPDLSDDIAKMKSEIEQLKNDKSNLNKALHKTRQKSKEVKEEEVLSKDQLKSILSENEGDPEAMLRVLEYSAEQIAKKVSSDTVSSAELKKLERESNDMLIGMYPSLAEESSDMRRAIDETKAHYGIENNPLGDLYATGIRVLNSLPSLIDAAEARGKEAGKKGIAESNRKKSIKDSDLDLGKNVKTAKGLSDTEAAAESQLNLTEGQKKIYKQLVGKKASSVSVEG